METTMIIEPITEVITYKSTLVGHVLLPGSRGLNRLATNAGQTGSICLMVWKLDAEYGEDCFLIYGRRWGNCGCCEWRPDNFEQCCKRQDYATIDPSDNHYSSPILIHDITFELICRTIETYYPNCYALWRK